MDWHSLDRDISELFLDWNSATSCPLVSLTPKKIMGVIADRLRQLTAEMKASDEKLQRLIDEHVTATTSSLEEMKNLIKD